MNYSDLVAFSRKFAVREDNVVAVEVVTAADLAGLLTSQLRKVHALAPDRPAGRQELKCAADVAEALARVTPEAVTAASRDFMPPPLAGLTGIPVIASPDSAPGKWRLVTHDQCEVRDGDDVAKAWVSHAKCSITGEGRIDGLHPRSA